MSTIIPADVVCDLPCFQIFSLIPKILNLPYTCLFTFCNIIMTGEPVHTLSKKRMAPEAMSSTERAFQLSVANLKVKWPLCFAFGSYTILQIKKGMRSATTINLL